MTIKHSISILAIALVSFAIAGCGTPANKNAHDSRSPSETGKGAEKDHADHVHAGHSGTHVSTNDGKQSDMEKAHAELAKLSPEDAASALKQHVCPVSGEMLGAMGAPEKIDVNGQQVWICCGDCKDKLLASPDEYLAKLKKE